MFIEFKTQDGKLVLLNKNHIVGIETEHMPVQFGAPTQGGTTLRIFATENRVYSLNTKNFKYQDIRDQLSKVAEIEELGNGQDKNSPVR